MSRGNIIAAVSVVVIASLNALNVQAKPLTLNERLSDFQQLNAVIDSGYGPLEYKKTKMKLDVVKLRSNFEQKIRNVKTNGEFFYLLRQYVASYHDGHFSAMVPSERMAMFPVMMERVQGKAIIDTVVQGLPAGMFPFQRGDEVVAINGRPVEEEIAELASYLGYGNPESEKHFATWLLFYRPGAMLPLPASTDLEISVKKRQTGQVETVKVEWLVQGDALDEDEAVPTTPPAPAPAPARSPLMAAGRSPAWAQMDLYSFSSKQFWDNFNQQRATAMGLGQAEMGYKCSGATRIKPPMGATIISKKPFVAYYHKTPYGNVGYLRVPHYMPQNPDGSPATEEWFAMYEYVIDTFEKNTVGMIIDQDHNCGGYVQFGNEFVGLFMDRPYQPMQFSLLASKGEYLKFSTWASMIPENTLMHDEMAKVADSVKVAWKNGVPMTKLISLDGKNTLPPHHIHYTKPIVMLIDDMAGSGGDGVPAMLQGFGRVKLLGSQTASMGGHVEPQPPLNYSQVQVNLTRSLFFRPDGTPIENNGAVPDYPYTPTLNDFMNGYQEYQAYYLKVLGELVQTPALIRR